jgi:hypothetical protein
MSTKMVWQTATDCVVVHEWGTEGWRPNSDGTHEHLVPMSEDTIRVIRVLEFTGPRGQVEATLRKRQVRGTYQIGAMTIREAIVGDFPEVVEVTSKSETSV